MRIVSKRGVRWALWAMALAVLSILGTSWPAAVVDVGQPAPDFKLPSTSGVDIGLGDFKGKKWVFLEFYAAEGSRAHDSSVNLAARGSPHRKIVS